MNTDYARMRFEQVVVRPDDATACWGWKNKPVAGTGYSSLSIKGRLYLGHRISYELHVGPIPAGLVIDHLCRNRACVNPQHLEAVTQQVNMLRGVCPSANAVRTGTCKHGHTLADAYTRKNGTGYLICRTCSDTRSRDWKRRQARRDGKWDKGAACKRGHPWTDATTYVGPRGVRECRICRGARAQRAVAV